MERPGLGYETFQKINPRIIYVSSKRYGDSYRSITLQCCRRSHLMAGPLSGIRVIDFTHALAGPFCTMLLGHLGAEIIKIEPPGGDRARRSWMPKGSKHDGYEWMGVNVNKKSIVINLKTETGRDVTKRLIAVSDVLVENYYPGTMEKFGLAYESVKELNPKLIYASNRGFGESGPYSRYGSNAGSNTAMTGWTNAAWSHSRAYGTKALGIGDQAGGVSAAVGVLAALYEREQSGLGQRIEVSMQEALIGFMNSTLHEHFTGNKVGGGYLKVADGYFNLRTRNLTDEQWRRLAAVMGREELISDQRFATKDARNEHKAELTEIVESWASGQTRQRLWQGLRDIAYLGAPVLSIGEVIEDEHIKARQAFVQREHPKAGTLTLVAPWVRLSRTPSEIRTVSPLLGQHTDDVLRGALGMSDQEISALREEGAVA